GTFEAVESVTAPRAYLIPPGWPEVIETLRAHGIRLQPVERSRELRLERFQIDSTRVADRPFQGHLERTAFGAYRTESRTVAAGWTRVATDQPLGRLAVALLEPRSDDGLVAWNAFDRAFEAGEGYPVLREPVP
ncbi:MAG: M14 family metallopeptidase, partial [Gemmatimonadota bacterium]